MFEQICPNCIMAKSSNDQGSKQNHYVKFIMPNEHFCDMHI